MATAIALAGGWHLDRQFIRIFKYCAPGHQFTYGTVVRDAAQSVFFRRDSARRRTASARIWLTFFFALAWARGLDSQALL
jgi:hypothetical protein